MATATITKNDELELNNYHPTLKQESEKLEHLRQQARQLTRRKAELESQLTSARSQKKDSVTRRAEQLLAGNPTTDPVAELERELRAVSEDLLVTQKAHELQSRVTRSCHSQASLNYCGELGPEHRAAVVRIAKALQELAAANDQEAALHVRVRAADAEDRLKSARFSALGSLGDSTSRVSQWFSEMRNAGLLD